MFFLIHFNSFPTIIGTFFFLINQIAFDLPNINAILTLAIVFQYTTCCILYHSSIIFLILVLPILIPSCVSSLVFFIFCLQLLLHSIKNETFRYLELISAFFVWSSCFNYDLVSSFFSEWSIFGKTVFLSFKIVSIFGLF